MVLKATELKTIQTEVTLSRNPVPTFINAKSSFEGGFNKDFPGRGTGKGKMSGCVKRGIGIKMKKGWEKKSEGGRVKAYAPGLSNST